MAKLPDSSVIKELAELLDSTGLTEIEVETSGVRIKVARSGTPVATTTYVAPQQAEPETPAPASVEAPTTAPAPAEDPADHPGAVKSPMVGTAYMSSEPGAAAFIKVGDMVSEGQTLLIVEAMKTMNPIASPRAGKVTQIIVQNEQPVEFDQPLVIIE
ncbi:MAG: acetyl-CoA carboxylase biotin carboxyl carrier protein [PS1 clade bacterium]|nr:acetyl-CoA carboxylase biotin carboxyl carrier protein [PS1 clade bacterium]CAI8357101.1 MAG: Biotin carboxyl carrier protein of acetyl-CoA carboxylase [Rhodobiaceae bacterium UBA7378]HCQ82424.1 acetyl-CoA carboxylase biotin carboxyl carrier protein [Rhodobiaceae bacterium]|tara:strand:+ start:4892 stop:5365 length:474 start_codon:yes stop_codon:yes gene_type:complete